jgi:hypothetical protein
MKLIGNLLRAFVGLVLVFVVHIPRLLYYLLLVSYAAVFNNQENLTADPKVHIARAKRLLKKDNAHLLYAALEIRLALERMTDTEVMFADAASQGILKKNDPVKKTNYLRVLNEATGHPHRIMVRSKATGEMVEIGQYKPLDQRRVREIDGRTGNLLHIIHGVLYGIADDPWYRQTRQFLQESADYLHTVLQDNTPFFAYETLEHIQLETPTTSPTVQ